MHVWCRRVDSHEAQKGAFLELYSPSRRTADLKGSLVCFETSKTSDFSNNTLKIISSNTNKWTGRDRGNSTWSVYLIKQTPYKGDRLLSPSSSQLPMGDYLEPNKSCILPQSVSGCLLSTHYWLLSGHSYTVHTFETSLNPSRYNGVFGKLAALLFLT